MGRPSKQMRDIDPKESEIILGGKSYKIVFRLGAIKYIASKYGSLMDALKFVQDKEALRRLDDKVIDVLVDLIIAGIRHQDKDFTPENIIDLIEVNKIDQIFTVLAESISEAMKQETKGPL